MSDDLNVLSRKRGSVKAKLTTFHKYVLKIKNEAESNKLSDTQITELRQRINRADHIISDFDEVQNNIDCIADDLEEQEREREEFEKMFYENISIAKTICESYEFKEGSMKSENIAQNIASNVNNVPVLPGSSGIKLPTIQLPRFDGSFESWLEFKDLFQSLIHANTQINEIQKFHYLRAALSGGAAQVIKNLEFSAANYNIAWDLLQDRFNNNRLLVQNHVKAIFNLENIQRESSIKIRSLLDNLSKHLRVLKQLNQPTEFWGTLLIFIISNKLDPQTAREWEQFKSHNNIPDLEDLKEFLKNKADLLESVENSTVSDKRAHNKKDFTTNKALYATNHANIANIDNKKCLCCKRDHYLYQCDEFKQLPVSEKISFVNNHRLCRNCLRGKHFSKECRFGGCRVCKAKHNTLLHDDSYRAGIREPQVSAAPGVQTPGETKSEALSASQASGGAPVGENSCSSIFSHHALAQNVLLSTAKIYVDDYKGKRHIARALLDNGSQSSFMTSALCNKLNLKRVNARLEICGINNAVTNIRYKTKVNINAIYNNYNASIDCFVIDEITGVIPNVKLNKGDLDIPQNIRLADPEFNLPNKIDMLLGADIFWNLLCVGQLNLGHQNPMLQKTRLGWIVSGPLNTHVNKINCNLMQKCDIQDQLAKFWQLEECPTSIPLSKEEDACENYFLKTFKRNESGRFVVSIPFKHELTRLGDSKEQAVRQFKRLENRLEKNEKLRGRYTDFLNEYLEMGHMTEIKDSGSESGYYMPHHGVIRETSSTTALRVVFNASAPTTTGCSLNELQMVGPTIQNDLISILIRFRKHNIVIAADIAKMYRQVLVEPGQRYLQKIIWRENPTEDVRVFQLNTVTYGTTSAPYLAIRCLMQLAYEYRNINSEISKIIENDFYVDDLLTGAESEERAINIKNQLCEVLLSGCFELRKWRSNNTNVIKHENDSNRYLEFSLNKNSETKTLGLMWSSNSDYLTYVINLNPHEQIKKRTILSCVAKVFDPLGLLSPCIIRAKILLQKLWVEKLSWDESLPNALDTSWREFKNDLPSLNNLKISRKVVCHNAIKIELHGFSDASEAAYGACVYIRSTNNKNENFVHLLFAKSKVAPIKPITIPRLELLGALVLARLVKKVVNSIELTFDNCFLWTDSTIVLGWLRTEPNLLKPFVNSRVAEIQELTNSCVWRHVPTTCNPADLISRGIGPKVILNNHLWWFGPEFLAQNVGWPNTESLCDELPEMRSKIKTLIAKQGNIELFPFNRFSNLMRLKRSFAYVIRFIKNCKLSKELRQCGELSINEINCSFETLIRMVQRESFPQDYSNLLSNRALNSSNLLSLCPFLDSHKIMRVGGRLKNSEFPFDKKHPILLPNKHLVTKLIFESEHKRLLHAGPQLLLSNIRDNFWPLGGRNLARAIVKKCIKCSRYSTRPFQPIMGNLPSSRLRPGFPFEITGVDYAGPFQLKNKRGRGATTIKGWISLFVCFSTRAIHLELVSDLSTQTFLQALRRFIARRGKPSHMYSDSGTNFVGAKNELQTLARWVVDNSQTIKDSLANESIQWHFIPSHAPHFGGIWEAGVKSTKHHLRRILGNASLVFEDFYTTLVQIEAVLNSRPLFPMSSDPNDLSSLTPAHFLVGKSLTSIPEPDLRQVMENRLSRFQRVQQLQQHFWERWNKEYIAELQQRVKWKTTQSALQEGMLVLVKEDNLPPMKWILGRVISVVKGNDNVARVAVIKTQNGVIKRAFSKLCPLPVNDICVESASFQGGGHVKADG